MNIIPFKEDKFQLIIEEFENFKRLKEEDVARLENEAMYSKNSPKYLWTAMENMLTEATSLSKNEIKSKIKYCKVHADLRAYPEDINDFIELFLKSRKLEMSYYGGFNHGDYDQILKKMNTWFGIIDFKMYSRENIRDAFDLWIYDKKTTILKDAYSRLKYNPLSNTKELLNFSGLITRPGFDETATFVSIANFIWRVKNHMRGKWEHKSHLMPVLYGPQGSYKTTAIEALTSPIKDFISRPSFDMFDDKSQTCLLKTMYVMFFDELERASNADMNKFKSIMTAENKVMVEKYEKSQAQAIIVSTFIGATNKPVNTQLVDETGNRRFIQIDTPDIIDIDSINEINFVKVWQSVDENAMAPRYEPSVRNIIEQVQSEQRSSFDPVENWFKELKVSHARLYSSVELFKDFYDPWCESNEPGERKKANHGTRLLTQRLAVLAEDVRYKPYLKRSSVKTENKTWWEIVRS